MLPAHLLDCLKVRLNDSSCLTASLTYPSLSPLSTGPDSIHLALYTLGQLHIQPLTVASSSRPSVHTEYICRTCMRRSMPAIPTRAASPAPEPAAIMATCAAWRCMWSLKPQNTHMFSCCKFQWTAAHAFRAERRYLQCCCMVPQPVPEAALPQPAPWRPTATPPSTPKTTSITAPCVRTR